MLEHIQNLDIILVNLKKANTTIVRAKSQFYQFSIKIVGYIQDFGRQHPNTSKVLKILDLPECMNIIMT